MIRKWQIAKPYTHIKITCITKQVQNAVDSQNLSATDAGLDQQSNQKKYCITTTMQNISSVHEFIIEIQQILESMT